MATPQPALVAPLELPGLGRAAITYAISELARRAGVTSAFFATWRIEFADQHFIDVYPVPGNKKRLRFPRVSPVRWKEIRAGHFYTSTTDAPLGTISGSSRDSDCKIPFSSSHRRHAGPLFTFRSDDLLECSVDLPLSTLLTLSRFEEMFPGPRDLHGRFAATSSIAWRDGFLHRPIIDEYGMALENVLKVLLPGWSPSQRHLQVKLSHDVDEIGIPFSFRGALGRTIRDRKPLASLRDLLSPVLKSQTAYQFYLLQLIQMEAECSLNSCVYWKCSPRSYYDTGYDPRDPRILQLIYLLSRENVVMGVHPSYDSFECFEILREQVESLRNLFGVQALGGRQDYLRWSPQTWTDWDALHLAYDSSVGFADHVGFRAGTSFPYRPWLWEQQRQAYLVEIPLLAMDSMLQGYMKLTPLKAELVLRELLERVRSVGGVFTLSWHNTRILHGGFAATYRAILDLISGSPTFDWRSLN